VLKNSSKSTINTNNENYKIYRNKYSKRCIRLTWKKNHKNLKRSIKEYFNDRDKMFADKDSIFKDINPP
jgi:hypothetical protein